MPPKQKQSKNTTTLPRRGGVFTAAGFLSIIIAYVFEKYVSCPFQAAMPELRRRLWEAVSDQRRAA